MVLHVLEGEDDTQLASSPEMIPDLSAVELVRLRPPDRQDDLVGFGDGGGGVTGAAGDSGTVTLRLPSGCSGVWISGTLEVSMYGVTLGPVRQGLGVLLAAHFQNHGLS